MIFVSSKSSVPLVYDNVLRIFFFLGRGRVIVFDSSESSFGCLVMGVCLA